MRGDFGFLPFIMGTLWVTAIAILLGLYRFRYLPLFSLTENSKSWVKRVVFPALDILAGLPSVVYGVWGYFSRSPLDFRIGWLHTLWNILQVIPHWLPVLYWGS